MSDQHRKRMGSQPPVLQAIIPLQAVPQRLALAVSRLVGEWGYAWVDVTFAGTVRVPGRSRQLDDQEQWVFAISAEPLGLGDPIVPGDGRASAVSVGRFAAGVIPATPYAAYVYERLGGRRGGPEPQARSPQPSPTTARAAPAVPDLLR